MSLCHPTFIYPPDLLLPTPPLPTTSTQNIPPTVPNISLTPEIPASTPPPVTDQKWAESWLIARQYSGPWRYRSPSPPCPTNSWPPPTWGNTISHQLVSVVASLRSVVPPGGGTPQGPSRCRGSPPMSPSQISGRPVQWPGRNVPPSAHPRPPSQVSSTEGPSSGAPFGGCKWIPCSHHPSR